MLEVHLGGIMYQQCHGLVGDLFPRLIPMWVHQRVKAHFIFLEQSVQRQGLFPGLHLGWQGCRGILSHASRRFHRSTGSTNVLQFASPKGSLSLAVRIQDFFRVHLPILTAC